MKILADNKKAYFDYEILEKFEAGIKLIGLEVKSAKAGRVSLKSSFAKFYNNELYLLGADIAPWQINNTPDDYESKRSRILLLTKKELKYLIGKEKENKLTILPLRFFLKNNLVKVELGLARGKKKYDKREAIKKKDIQRDIDRNIKM